jgi:hypothetical protein
LDSINPSMRKQLTCLDNFLVDGLNGMKELGNILDVLENCDNVPNYKGSLIKLELYIKIGFSLSCSEISLCRSHCSSCALSVPKNC